MSAPPSVVNGVDFVSVPSRDMTAARAFYENVLGLPCSALWRDEDPLGAEFETGSLTLAVIDSERLGLEFRPINHPIALHVDDFAAAKAELESRGVAFKGETIDSGVCLQAFFEDPDGNTLGIHHRYAPKPSRG